MGRTPLGGALWATGRPRPAPLSKNQAFHNLARPARGPEKLEGEEDIYSARIGLDYRALAVKRKNRVVGYWIGSHAQYNRLV